MLFPCTWELRNRTWLFCQRTILHWESKFSGNNAHAIVIEQGTGERDLAEDPDMSAEPSHVWTGRTASNPQFVLRSARMTLIPSRSAGFGMGDCYWTYGIIDEHDNVKETDFDQIGSELDG
jgi:hypothetical protein